MQNSRKIAHLRRHHTWWLDLLHVLFQDSSCIVAAAVLRWNCVVFFLFLLDIEPNRQTLLRFTKLIFFNSSSTRSLTPGQPRGNWLMSSSLAQNLPWYRSSTLTQRASWLLFVFGKMILEWIVPQYLSHNSTKIVTDPSLYACVLLIISGKPFFIVAMSRLSWPKTLAYNSIEAYQDCID